MTDAESLERIKEWAEQWQSISPADIQWLLARIEALEAEVAHMREANGKLHDEYLKTGYELAQSQAEHKWWQSNAEQMVIRRLAIAAPEAGAEEVK